MDNLSVEKIVMLGIMVCLAIAIAIMIWPQPERRNTRNKR